MRTAYLDIETSYVGAFTDGRLFKDFANRRKTRVGIHEWRIPITNIGTGTPRVLRCVRRAVVRVAHTSFCDVCDAERGWRRPVS